LSHCAPPERVPSAVLANDPPILADRKSVKPKTEPIAAIWLV